MFSVKRAHFSPLAPLLVAAVALGGVAISSPASAAPILPAPGGDTAVGVTDLSLVDRDREDPWAPGTRRELAVTVTYPAASGIGREPAEYVPGSGLQTNGHLDAPVAASGRRSLPVVLFSPGFYIPRTLSTGTAEHLAGRGYVVISIDHTGDALATVFPDGRVVPQRMTDSYSDATLRKAIDARVADARFVIDFVESLGRGDAQEVPLPEGLADAVDPSRIGMFGHSMGGASTAEVLRTEPRLDAGVNLDGALFYGTAPSPIVTEGTTRPLLSVISSLHADSREGRERFWDQYFRTPRGWSRVYAIADTGHASFTDAEHFVPQSVPDLPAFQIPGGLSLGTAPRHEVTRTIDGLVTAMFDRHLKNRQDPVLENPTPRYPLVREVR
nr:Tat pathway signal protein [Rhodococcus oryzae]